MCADHEGGDVVASRELARHRQDELIVDLEEGGVCRVVPVKLGVDLRVDDDEVCQAHGVEVCDLDLPHLAPQRLDPPDHPPPRLAHLGARVVKVVTVNAHLDALEAQSLVKGNGVGRGKAQGGRHGGIWAAHDEVGKAGVAKGRRDGPALGDCVVRAVRNASKRRFDAPNTAQGCRDADAPPPIGSHCDGHDARSNSRRASGGGSSRVVVEVVGVPVRPPIVDVAARHPHPDLVHARHPHDDRPRLLEPRYRHAVVLRPPRQFTQEPGTLVVEVAPDVDGLLDTDRHAVERPQGLARPPPPRARGGLRAGVVLVALGEGAEGGGAGHVVADGSERGLHDGRWGGPAGAVGLLELQGPQVGLGLGVEAPHPVDAIGLGELHVLIHRVLCQLGDGVEGGVGVPRHAEGELADLDEALARQEVHPEHLAQDGDVVEHGEDAEWPPDHVRGLEVADVIDALAAVFPALLLPCSS
mmetsp:Transcript_114/g.334  ORF Transcript_114/g.334 Transcript_114/m.334 type:complete len:470 (-) Transcript_114:184-1593(-)